MKDLIAIKKPQSTFRLIRALCRTMGKTQWKIHQTLGMDLIRTADRKLMCPLAFAATVATGRPFCTSAPSEAWISLGIGNILGSSVASAADSRTTSVNRSPRHRKLRQILLKAAGL